MQKLLVISIFLIMLFLAGCVQIPKGDTGPQGLKGDTGPIGPQGLKGDRGLAGPRGPLVTVAELPCPKNMTRVGAFCIDKTSNSATSIHYAMVKCQKVNKTICDISELYIACHAGAITIATGGEWSSEWITGLGGQIMPIVVQNLPEDCGGNLVGDPSYTSKPFHCCQ